MSKEGWVCERTLGSGSFGLVHLYVNEKQSREVAVKTCRMVDEMTPKHRERWQTEVAIMMRLSHPNVIKALPVPHFLLPGPNEPAVLGMEYCSGGDLRKVLLKPENACGLREADLKKIASDVSSGIQYLHSIKVIHRDLKPENIVLHPGTGETVYKIIDLGYAKEVNPGSVCMSFAGTMQYLAPELLSQKKYTCTVDYWSLGTLIYECITGVRPFLPSLHPYSSLEFVSNKRDNHICAYYQLSGEAVYDDTIPQPNYLCRCFKILDKILETKVIYVFCVSQTRMLTYPYPSGEANPMDSVLRALEKETNIPIANQLLLSSSGVNFSLEMRDIPMGLENIDNILFLFDKVSHQSSQSSMQSVRQIPSTVQFIMNDPKTVLNYLDQKVAWAHSMFFCNETAADFKYLVMAQRAAMNHLLRIHAALNKSRNVVVTEIVSLNSILDHSQSSLEFDMRLYKDQIEAGGVESGEFISLWEAEAECLENLRDLKNRENSLDQNAKSLQTKILELQRNPYSAGRFPQHLDDIAKDALALFSDLKNTPKEDRKLKTNNEVMVAHIVKCIKHRDVSRGEVMANLDKIFQRNKEVLQLLPQFQQLMDDIKEGHHTIQTAQIKRQQDIWSLLDVLVQKSTRGLSRHGSHTSIQVFNQQLEKSMNDSMLALAISHTAQNDYKSLAPEQSSLEQPAEIKEHPDKLDWSYLDDDLPRL